MAQPSYQLQDKDHASINVELVFEISFRKGGTLWLKKQVWTNTKMIKSSAFGLVLKMLGKLLKYYFYKQKSLI